MGLLSKIFGGATAQPIEAVGNVLDKLFTSDDERLDKQALLTKLALQPQLAQTEINKVEASHRTWWVAGWRPAIGWVCAASLFFFYVPQYMVATVVWIKLIVANNWGLVPYPVDAKGVMELVLALLGMGALRTVEKGMGKTK